MKYLNRCSTNFYFRTPEYQWLNVSHWAMSIHIFISQAWVCLSWFIFPCDDWWQPLNFNSLFFLYEWKIFTPIYVKAMAEANLWHYAKAKTYGVVAVIHWHIAIFHLECSRYHVQHTNLCDPQKAQQNKTEIFLQFTGCLVGLLN